MIKLTNLKFEPRGRHDSMLAYSVTDTVTSADGSRAYVAVKDVPAGIALTDTAYWVNILDLSSVLEETNAAVVQLNGVIANAETAASNANAAAAAGVRTDALQNLTAAQKDTAQENIGLKAIVNGLTDGFSASGNPVQCNPVGGLVFDGVETEFTPKQEGEGDPYPAGGGKNKCPIAVPGTETNNGVTFEAGENGVWHVTGANTAGSIFFKAPSLWEFTLLAGTYTMSGIDSSAGGTLYLQLLNVGTMTEVVSITGGSPVKTFTLSEDTNVRLRFFVQNTTEVIDSWFYPQIEAGSAATEFAPYSNIRPISGYESLSVIRGGKNLIDKDNLQFLESPGDIITPLETGIRITSTVTGLWRTTFINLGKIDTFMGKTLTFSAKMKASAANTPGVNLSVRKAAHSLVETLVDITSNGSHMLQIQDKEEYHGAYLCMMLYSNRNGTLAVGDYVDYTDLMLEFGSEATAYEPYQGDTYTIQFGQTIYGGRMNWLTGELTAEWTCVTFDGTQTGVWVTNNGNDKDTLFTFITSSASDVPRVKSAGKCLSSHVPYSVSPPVTQIGCGTSSGASLYLNFGMSMTQAEFNSMLGSNPVQIAYELAEPIIIQLAPQQIAAVQGVNTLYGDGDVIHVEGRQSKTIALETRIAALEAAVLNA